MPDPVIRYVVQPPPQRPPWWLSVKCDWCKSGWKWGDVHCRGCMMCAREQANVAAVVAIPEFRQWRAAMMKDPYDTPLIFADRLEDMDQPEIAEAFRLAHAEAVK